MEPPPPVAGVRWRAGRPEDADAVAAVGAAADRTDEAGHVRTRSDVVQLLAAQLDHARSVEPDAPAMTVRSVGESGVAPLARRAGFSPARVFSTMRRDLAEPVGAVALPGGLRLVPLRPEMDEPLRLAKNAIFRDHWQTLPEGAAEWRAGSAGPRLVRERSRVAVDEQGDIAGFVLVHRVEERPQRASIPLVGTARRHRGRGLARALLASALSAAAQAGLADAELDVDADGPTEAGRVYAPLG